MTRKTYRFARLGLILLGLLAVSIAEAQCDNAPIANDDQMLLAASPALIDALANDEEPDGERLRLTVLSTDCPVSYAVLGDVLELTPAPAVRQDCTVSYQIEDDSSNAASATIFVTSAEFLFADGFESGSTAAWSASCSSC